MASNRSLAAENRALLSEKRGHAADLVEWQRQLDAAVERAEAAERRAAATEPPVAAVSEQKSSPPVMETPSPSTAAATGGEAEEMFPAAGEGLGPAAVAEAAVAPLVLAAQPQPHFQDSSEGATAAPAISSALAVNLFDGQSRFGTVLDDTRLSCGDCSVARPLTEPICGAVLLVGSVEGLGDARSTECEAGMAAAAEQLAVLDECPREDIAAAAESGPATLATPPERAAVAEDVRAGDVDAGAVESGAEQPAAGSEDTRVGDIGISAAPLYLGPPARTAVLATPSSLVAAAVGSSGVSAVFGGFLPAPTAATAGYPTHAASMHAGRPWVAGLDGSSDEDEEGWEGELVMKMRGLSLESAVHPQTQLGEDDAALSSDGAYLDHSLSDRFLMFLASAVRDFVLDFVLPYVVRGNSS